jgi:peptide/nickel transport system substrate-binding protein
VTAEDVKFSFERYRGNARQVLKDRVAAVETPDVRRVRFKLKQPWPDFLTFYVEATGAGWIVPKTYMERVGDEGYKKAPVAAGPYRFVSFTPGVELTLEAFGQYWRKTPSVERLVFRAIPDEATRVVALKWGEVDIIYSIRGELAEELARTKGLTLKPIISKGTFWLYFADQWDPRSPWHDQRVRRAADLAIDRETINQALMLGHAKLTGSIIPDIFEYYWQPPAPTYDPARAKQLLAEAGYPQGFDAGEYNCDGSYADVAEPVLNNLQQVGIRTKLRPLERAAFVKAYGQKSLKNIIQGQSGAFGNAATRLEAFVAKGCILCVRQLSRHRRAVPGAGERTRPRSARSDTAQDPATCPRARNLRATLATGIHQRHRLPGGRIRTRSDPGPRLLIALRGRDTVRQVAAAEAHRINMSSSTSKVASSRVLMGALLQCRSIGSRR